MSKICCPCVLIQYLRICIGVNLNRTYCSATNMFWKILKCRAVGVIFPLLYDLWNYIIMGDLRCSIIWMRYTIIYSLCFWQFWIIYVIIQVTDNLWFSSKDGAIDFTSIITCSGSSNCCGVYEVVVEFIRSHRDH